MNRVQFIVLTVLSSLVGLTMVLQLVLANWSASDQNELRIAADKLQTGQVAFSHLQQVAARTAQLAQQTNDPQLKDLLARNNIQINTNQAPSAPATPPPAPTAPAAH